MTSLAKKIQNSGFDSDSEHEDDDLLNSRPWSDYLHPAVCCSATLHLIASGWRQAFVFLKLNVKDIGSRKVNYCLGLLSCFIVVLVTALMLTVLTRLPILFLKLAELERGELDFSLAAGGDASRASSLNYSKIVNRDIFSTGQYSYHAPRITVATSNSDVRANAIRNCSFESLDDVWNSSKGNGTNCERTLCVNNFCSVEENTFDVNHWNWIDSVKERRAGMGAKFPDFGYPNGIPAGKIIIDENGAAQLGGLKVGDQILLSGLLRTPIREALIQSGLMTSISFPGTVDGGVGSYFAAPFEILGIITENYGKAGTDSTPFMVSEYNNTLAYISGFMSPLLPQDTQERLAATDPYEFAEKIYWNYPPANRFERYTYADYARVLSTATSFAGPIVTSVGFNQVTIEVPVVEFMGGTRFFSLFLGLIMSIIIVGLGALSIVLVYSLLIVGVQTRQFELGVMRMVGFTRSNLVTYIITGASLFAVPATIVGLIAAQGAFIVIRGVMESALGVALPPELTPDAVGLALFAGLAIPLLASIAPILEVLSQALPDALNTARGRIQAIIFDIRTDADRPIDWTLVVFGAALVAFGFLIYYLFPLALFTFNLQLLFYIFFALLLGMLFGAILLAMNFDHFAQTLVAYTFFFIEREAVFKLVRSNLIAHRQRNRSNSLMFATAVGFIVFITVAFDIQIQSVKYEAARFYGGNLLILPNQDPETGGYMSYTQMQQIQSHLTSLKAAGTIAADTKWTWVAQDLKQFPSIPNATMDTLGRYKTFTDAQIVAASPDFFEVADPSFLIVDSTMDLPNDYTFNEYLYSREGSGRAVISSFQKREFAIEEFDGQNDMYQYVLTRPRVNESDFYDRSIALPAAVIDATPVLRMSRFPQRGEQPSVMSMPSWLLRANGTVNSMHDTRYIHFTVRCSREDATKIVTSAFPDNSLSGNDVRLLQDREENLELASTIVGFFFVFTQAISMAVCFFALISTMSTNIYEQAKEIGIMRAIGTPKTQVKRIFLEEAFVLVFAACLLGTLVGTVVAYTMLIQRALFTQLPLPFSFPYFNVLLMFILSMLFSAGSTYGPITALLNAKSVTEILRKN